MSEVQQGQPMFANLKYCIRCCIPETQEGIKFDEMGICLACRSSEEKIHIDWASREKELRTILQDAQAKAGDNYDCIVPISGGKDSVFQIHVLVNVYKMKPLAVTFSHNWFSKTGWYNLLNALEKFNVDHIMFTPNRNLVNRIARRSIEAIGDACWHCHAGCGAFPLQIAAAYKIPLLVYGESVAESSGRESYKCRRHTYDREYFTKVSAKQTSQEMVCDYLSQKDLFPFNIPSERVIDEVGIRGIHLGDYLFWDEERQTEFVRDTYGWKETEIEGTYKRYKSAECVMPGIHDFSCYLKRGYGRGSFHASLDVRNGLLTREEGFVLAKKHDQERPNALDYFLKITGMSEEDFYRIMQEKHRVAQLKGLMLPIKEKHKLKIKEIRPFVEQFLEEYDNHEKAVVSRAEHRKDTESL